MSKIAKICSYGVLFFINATWTISHYICLNLKSCFQFFYYILIILYHFGEEKFIKNTSFLFPKNVAMIINNEKIDNITTNIINFIRWSIYSNIKQLTIYDPFNLLTKSFIESTLINLISDNFSKNFTIGLSYDNVAIDLKKKKEVNRKEMLSYSFDIIISVINFKSANNELIEKVIKSNEDYPKELEYYQGKNDRVIKDDSKYESFYTRKKALGLPEVVICFGYEDICLYGFPFSMLENSEIAKINDDFSNFNVIDFVKLFKKYAKVNKRFGQ